MSRGKWPGVDFQDLTGEIILEGKEGAAYTAAITKEMKKYKQDLDADSMYQDTKGTGRNLPERGFTIVFADGSYYAVHLEKPFYRVFKVGSGGNPAKEIPGFKYFEYSGDPVIDGEDIVDIISEAHTGEPMFE